MAAVEPIDFILPPAGEDLSSIERGEPGLGGVGREEDVLILDQRPPQLHLEQARFDEQRDAVPGASVTVSCKHKGCPFKLRRRTTDRFGEVSLTRLFKGRRLRSGIRLEVQIAAPRMITKVTRFDIRRGVNPTGRGLCIPVGELKPRRRC